MDAIIGSLHGLRVVICCLYEVCALHVNYKQPRGVIPNRFCSKATRTALSDDNAYRFRQSIVTNENIC